MTTIGLMYQLRLHTTVRGCVVSIMAASTVAVSSGMRMSDMMQDDYQATLPVASAARLSNSNFARSGLGRIVSDRRRDQTRNRTRVRLRVRSLTMRPNTPGTIRWLRHIAISQVCNTGWSLDSRVTYERVELRSHSGECHYVCTNDLTCLWMFVCK